MDTYQAALDAFAFTARGGDAVDIWDQIRVRSGLAAANRSRARHEAEREAAIDAVPYLREMVQAEPYRQPAPCEFEEVRDILLAAQASSHRDVSSDARNVLLTAYIWWPTECLTLPFNDNADDEDAADLAWADREEEDDLLPVNLEEIVRE